MKILYTDYNYAVVYVCDEVSKDGSCDQDQVEVEVMSRNKDTVPDDVKDTLLAVIEGVCLSKDDFEEITQTCESSELLFTQINCLCEIYRYSQVVLLTSRYSFTNVFNSFYIIYNFVLRKFKLNIAKFNLSQDFYVMG